MNDQDNIAAFASSLPSKADRDVARTYLVGFLSARISDELAAEAIRFAIRYLDGQRRQYAEEVAAK